MERFFTNSWSICCSITLLLVFFISGCAKDSEFTQGSYGSGYFIVNEGSLGSATGTLTHVSDKGAVTLNVFEKGNGISLGKEFKSIREIGTKYYLSVSGAEMVYVVEKSTLKERGVFQGLNNPSDVASSSAGRFYVTSGDKTFLHLLEVESATYGLTSDSVALNTSTSQVSSNFKPAKFLSSSNRLFISGAGRNSFVVGYISDVSVRSKDVEYISLPKHNPVDIVMDKDFMLWVLCTGKIDNNDQGTVIGKSEGGLYAINSDTKSIVKNFRFPDAPLSATVVDQPSNLRISSDGATLYYMYKGFVYDMKTNQSELNTKNRLLEASKFQKFDVQGDRLYGIKYAALGIIYVYDISKRPAVELKSFTVGAYPNALFFPTK